MFKNQDIRKRKFSEIDLSNPFFDTLRESYQGFEDWFHRKGQEEAYVMEDENGMQAFLYLKIEHGPVTDITPPLNAQRCLKVGTFKINGHGTKLGERFVKKIFDHAIVNEISHIYVTVFPQHLPLINILERFGFERYGEKLSSSGEELVFLKDFSILSEDTHLDYPVVNTLDSRIWLLSIYSEWHTRLFPDSILRTESASIVEDTSHTNSIHKVYIAFMHGMDQIKPNDVIIIYRCADKPQRPWFKSVITSICTITDSLLIGDFSSFEKFQKFAGPHSVFSQQELNSFYNRRKNGHIIKMTYNIALPKRLTMQQLVEDVGLEREDYWGFRQITKDQIKKIAAISKVPPNTMIL